jgi:predicted anti-sigma-YlaC factor YlaD
MLSCKDVCYIVSESLDGKLPLHKRLSVRFHLLMCKACQRMVQQMKLLRAAAHRYESSKDKKSPPDQETLSKEASARILARLQQAKNHSADHE